MNGGLGVFGAHVVAVDQTGTAWVSALSQPTGLFDLRFLPRDTEMAVALQGRARLYRTADGKLLDERVSDTQTEFRRYVDWTADEGKPLRQALDTAVAELGRSLAGEVSAPRPLPPP